MATGIEAMRAQRALPIVQMLQAATEIEWALPQKRRLRGAWGLMRQGRRLERRGAVAARGGGDAGRGSGSGSGSGGGGGGGRRSGAAAAVGRARVESGRAGCFRTASGFVRTTGMGERSPWSRGAWLAD